MQKPQGRKERSAGGACVTCSILESKWLPGGGSCSCQRRQGRDCEELEMAT